MPLTKKVRSIDEPSPRRLVLVVGKDHPDGGANPLRQHSAHNWPTDGENRRILVASAETRHNRTVRPFVQVIGIIGW